VSIDRKYINLWPVGNAANGRLSLREQRHPGGCSLAAAQEAFLLMW